MPVEPGKFACQSCGRSFRWTEKLAGKRVKCKCSAALHVPDEEPGMGESAPDFGALEPAEETATQAEAPADYSPAASTKAAKSAPDEKVKWSERRWNYVGLGVLRIPLSFYEYSRQSDLESEGGPASIRVTQLPGLGKASPRRTEELGRLLGLSEESLMAIRRKQFDLPPSSGFEVLPAGTIQNAAAVESH